mmetsp:Transcript_30806/g.69156  ORF Transcript_30806/g.69156 Transcript_30806/m.69156 type:complete len:208 (-) Transcript_30806:259-882(-)
MTAAKEAMVGAMTRRRPRGAALETTSGLKIFSYAQTLNLTCKSLRVAKVTAMIPTTMKKVVRVKIVKMTTGRSGLRSTTALARELMRGRKKKPRHRILRKFRASSKPRSLREDLTFVPSFALATGTSVWRFAGGSTRQVAAAFPSAALIEPASAPKRRRSICGSWRGQVAKTAHLKRLERRLAPAASVETNGALTRQAVALALGACP